MIKSARGVALSVLASHGDLETNADDLEDPRDVGLVNELVQGVLRWRDLLDHVLVAFTDRSFSGLSPKVKYALRVGAYEMLFMGTPPYAAVNSVVGLFPKRAERGFINGVLRALSRNLGHVCLPDIDEYPLEYAAVRYSCPEWIVRKLLGTMDMPMVQRFLSEQNRKTEMTLRLRNVDRASYFNLLKEEGYNVREGRLGISLRIAGGGDPRHFPGFEEGLFVIQDEASMLSSLCLSPERGDVVWDVCAAPGTKTTHLADLTGTLGRVLASDIDETRLKMIQGNVDRLKLNNVEIRKIDASNPSNVEETLGYSKGEIDKILLDAPCSGLGVMGKNARLRWQRRETDIPAMAQRQMALLETCAGYLGKGGTLLYSVCTLTQEETRNVIRRFLERHQEFRPDSRLSELVANYTGMSEEGQSVWNRKGLSGPGFFYLLPEMHGTDGFFIAKMWKAG